MNSEHSDASTSGSEKEFELEQHEYERRRELYLSKIIFCERKYQEIKPVLLKSRLDQIEKLQDSILNRRSEIYLSRKAVLDSEFDAKRKHIEILRKLRFEAFHRRLAADRYNITENLQNNKLLAKESIGESIREKYEKILMEQLEVEKMTELSFDVNGDSDVNDIKRPNISRYMNRKNNGERLWCNLPVVLEQLSSNKIAADLQIISNAVSNSA